MSICAFIGDSIALGLALVAPPCDKAAVVGISTPAIIREVPTQQYQWAVLSAGSNDMHMPLNRIALHRNLLELRRRVQAKRVIWIAPMHPFAAARVIEVAAYYGDEVQSFTQTNDGLHPKNYHSLWRLVKERIDE